MRGRYLVLGFVFLALWAHIRYGENFRLTTDIAPESLEMPVQELISQDDITTKAAKCRIVVKPQFKYTVSGVIIAAEKVYVMNKYGFSGYHYTFMFADNIKNGIHKDMKLKGNELTTRKLINDEQMKCIDYILLDKAGEVILSSLEVGDQVSIQGIIGDAAIYRTIADEQKLLATLTAPENGRVQFIRNVSDVKVLKRGSRKFKYMFWACLWAIFGLGVNRLRKPF